jgi:excinuclease ABC subunit A
LATVPASHTGAFLRPHFPSILSSFAAGGGTASPNAGPQPAHVPAPDAIKTAKSKFIPPEKKTGRPTAKAPAKKRVKP